MMRRINMLIAPVALATLSLGIPQADAARVDMDVNHIQVDAQGAFDSEFTGTLLVSNTPETLLVSIAVGDEERLGSNLSADISGYIDLINGTVNGGFLQVITDGGDTYDADIRENGGSVVQAINSAGLYQLGGLTFDGQFTDADGDGLFGGVDLDGLLGENQPGNFLVLDYRPDDQGQDVADIEIRAVPLPSAALLGAPLVLGLPVLRRTISRFRG